MTLHLFFNTCSLWSREGHRDDQLSVAHDCPLGDRVANDKFAEMLLEHISIFRPPHHHAALRCSQSALGFILYDEYFGVSGHNVFVVFVFLCFCSCFFQTVMKTSNVH